MADPTKPPVAYSYSGFQTINPTKPLPAAQVDNDLANHKTAIDSAVDAIKDIRRSDGHLANRSVGPDQLSPALTIGFTNRGTWTTATAYSGGDGVTYGQVFYSARLAHTSTSGSRPDLDPATWQFLFTFANITLVDGSVTTAKLADGSVAFVKLAADAVVGAQVHAATALTSLVDADEVGAWGSVATALRKITWANVKATFWAALGGLIAAGTAKAVPVDADGLVLSDSEASGATKTLSFANLKAWLQSAAVPAGFVMFSPKGTAAAGWLVCEGGTFVQATYPALYAYLGSTTLPNYSDRVLRGAGTLAGSVYTTQEDAIRNITGGFNLRGSSGGFDAFVPGGAIQGDGADGSWSTPPGGSGGQAARLDASLQVPTAAENRVKSAIGKFVIKAH